MYMSVWSGVLKPDMVEEAIAVNETQIRSVVPNATGLIKLVTGLDRRTNKIITIGLWNAAEDAAALRNSPEFQVAFAKLLPYCAVVPTPEAFEIVLDT